VARYRFFFNPIRYTSLGLAVIEAMMTGVPIVGLATTEMATLIHSGHNGYVSTNPAVLEDVMQSLLREPGLAREWGERGRHTAIERFGIARFVNDWNAAFEQVCT
jgi:glycosyltransferase involved in cell wall biosynthesis